VAAAFPTQPRRPMRVTPGSNRASCSAFAGRARELSAPVLIRDKSTFHAPFRARWRRVVPALFGCAPERMCPRRRLYAAMYINAGAWVDEGTMVDSHALVGSCAQVGRRVHLSAAAQIGGVLEAGHASPVVIEDDVLVGGNCGIYEGTISARARFIAAETILHARHSSLRSNQWRDPAFERERPLIIPEQCGGCGRFPPVAAAKAMNAAGSGPQPIRAGDREVPRRF